MNENERENLNLVPTEEPGLAPAAPETPGEGISAQSVPIESQTIPFAASADTAPGQAAPTLPVGPYTQGYSTSGAQASPPYYVPTPSAYPPPPLPQIYYQLPQEKPVPPLNGLATASMVLGIVSMALTCCCCGMFSWLLSLIGLVMGIVACAKRNRSGVTVAGIILNSLSLVFALITVVAIVLNASIQYQNFESDFLDEIYIGSSVPSSGIIV